MTAWRRPILATERATRSGSSGSFQVGLPVLTLQKPQRRVHVSPRIMNVAVPRSQHSPTFGQAASWQTVCRFSASIMLVQLAVLRAARRRDLEPRRLAAAERLACPCRAPSCTSIPPGFARERVTCSRGGVVLTPTEGTGRHRWIRSTASRPWRAAARGPELVRHHDASTAKPAARDAVGEVAPVEPDVVVLPVGGAARCSGVDDRRVLVGARRGPDPAGPSAAPSRPASTHAAQLGERVARRGRRARARGCR